MQIIGMNVNVKSANMLGGLIKILHIFKIKIYFFIVGLLGNSVTHPISTRYFPTFLAV
jgi:hypothetical protein